MAKTMQLPQGLVNVATLARCGHRGDPGSRDGLECLLERHTAGNRDVCHPLVRTPVNLNYKKTRKTSYPFDPSLGEIDVVKSASHNVSLYVIWNDVVVDTDHEAWLAEKNGDPVVGLVGHVVQISALPRRAASLDDYAVPHGLRAAASAMAHVTTPPPALAREVVACLGLVMVEWMWHLRISVSLL